MKSLKKVAPIMATGLVVAGLGTVDAFAADTVDTPAPPAPPAEVEKQAAPAPSTEINKVTTDTPKESENGVTTTTGTVNPSVDTDNNITGQGSLDITTTPGESETETTKGDPTTSTTTNPDGSTTTTTTTPTETTTTEESTTDITGEVEGGTSEPTEEEKEKVKDNLGENWTDFKQNIKDKYGDTVDVTDGKDEDGNPTHTFEFSESSETSRPLGKDELSAVLGGVTLTDKGDGTYTYTKDGATVTVKVTGDNSTETTTTKWTVTVTETTKTESGSVDVGDKPVSGIVDTGSASVKDILDKAQGGTLENVTKDDAGNITKIVDGTKTYEFTYTPGTPTKLDTSKLTADQLNSLFPSEGKYEEADGKIFQTIGGVLRELKFDSDTQTLTVTEYTISMTVTDTQGTTEDKTQGSEAEANKQAIIEAVTNAVMDAIKADGLTNYTGDVKTQVSQNPGEEGSWTVKVTANNKEYTYTVKMNPLSSDGGETWSAEIVEEKNIEGLVDGSGSTTTITGNAYVSGKTVVWTENKDSSSSFIGDNGQVNVKEGDKIGTGETVSSVTSTETGAIVVTTYPNADGNLVTKTYTFLYNQEVTDEEKATLLSGNQTADFDKLTKTTWTVTETTEMSPSQ